MKTCYVSIPFGVRDGIDFEWTYHEIIAPAVTAAGLICQRGDQFGGAALIQKAILQAVITSDVVIADVSNANPNVMYELGIRHALRRGVTILLTSGDALLPFHARSVAVLHYARESTAGNVAAMRELVTSAIQDRLSRVTNDSPLYEYFRGLHVELGGDLTAGEPGYAYPAATRPTSHGRDHKKDVVRAEEATRATGNVDPRVYIDIFTRYRDLSAWQEVVRLAESLPPSVADSPQVVPIVALALNRLGEPKRAIDLLRRYTDKTGGDSESDGLLGSMHKMQYFAEHRPGDLQNAVESYRRGFTRDPRNLYLGRALAVVLQQKGRSAAAELDELLPRLRAMAAARLEASPLPDYWDLECALILDVLARDWIAAREIVAKIHAIRPQSWMLDSSRSELEDLGDAGLSGDDLSSLNELLGGMREPVGVEEEGDDA